MSDPGRSRDSITIISGRARKLYFAAVFSLAIVLFVLAPEVFLLFFCCVLFATFLAAICDFIEQHSSLRRKWSLTLGVALLLVLAALAGWLVGPQMYEQFNRLIEQLPRAVSNAREKLATFPLGSQLLAGAQGIEGSLGRVSSGAFSKASSVLSSTLGVVVQLFVIFFVGLYLAIDPSLYVKGFARLFPTPKRKRIREILNIIGTTLKRWLLGRFLLMAVNGVVTAIGLLIMGVPLAVTLGLISAVLNFIPNFGPFIAAAPAVLIALAESPEKGLQVAIFYLIYQMFDGYVLTPLVQSRTATLPAAIVLMSQVLFGVLFGFMGVLVAVPLAAIALVLYREVHIKDVLQARM